MIHLKRLFSTASSKGTENYIKTQRKYEILRTILYFIIPCALFAAGYIQTKSRANLLTVVAMLGFLPASKSLVSVIMFLRAKGCSPETAAECKKHSEGLDTLFDCVFTSYKKNYYVSHMAVRGNTLCGFTEEKQFEESEFYKHINDLLKLEGHRDITVKIFQNPAKYTERLEQMKNLEADEAKTMAIIETLKNVML